MTLVLYARFNRDTKILELLYEEAKYNILSGRYPCEVSDYIMLGGIQAALELGTYNASEHSPAFFRSCMYRFLPEHATVSSGWSSWVPWKAAGKNSPENRLFEQFKVTLELLLYTYDPFNHLSYFRQSRTTRPSRSLSAATWSSAGRCHITAAPSSTARSRRRRDRSPPTSSTTTPRSWWPSMPRASTSSTRPMS